VHPTEGSGFLRASFPARRAGLTELSDAGILSRLDLGDSIRRFELLQRGAAAMI
jgi:hypothetical protein